MTTQRETRERINALLDQIEVTANLTVGMVDQVVKLLNDVDSEDAAHEAEDRLHQAVLRAIASGRCRILSADIIASAALKTKEINFVRYYS